MSTQTNVAILIPMYNEEWSIENVLSQIDLAMSSFEGNYSIIVVDDGSADESVAIATPLVDTIINLPENNGVGYAMRVGLNTILESGNFTHVVKFDADMQHRPEKIPEVCKLLTEGVDLVICSRFHPESEHHHIPFDRALLNALYTALVKQITGWTHLTDVHSGFLGFNTEVAHLIANHLKVTRYGIPIEMILNTWRHLPQACVKEVPHPAIYKPADVCECLGQNGDLDKQCRRYSDTMECLLNILSGFDELVVGQKVNGQVHGLALGFGNDIYSILRFMRTTGIYKKK